jgi:hypothetical protein
MARTGPYRQRPFGNDTYLPAIVGPNALSIRNNLYHEYTAVLSLPLQHEFHVERTKKGIVAVGFYLDKTERAIQCSRRRHGGNCIEPYYPVPQRTGIPHPLFGELPPDPSPPECGFYIETLHLAGIVIQFSYRNAAGRLAIDEGEPKPAIGLSVVSRHTGEFTLEILKAEVKSERICILTKEPFRHSQFLVRLHDDEFHHEHCSLELLADEPPHRASTTTLVRN